jgi:hypothetical protein
MWLVPLLKTTAIVSVTLEASKTTCVNGLENLALHIIVTHFNATSTISTTHVDHVISIGPNGSPTHIPYKY